MWLFIMNILLRLFVNTCVSNWVVCMVFYGDKYSVNFLL